MWETCVLCLHSNWEPAGTHNIDITQKFGYFSLGGGTYCGWVKWFSPLTLCYNWGTAICTTFWSAGTCLMFKERHGTTCLFCTCGPFFLQNIIFLRSSSLMWIVSLCPISWLIFGKIWKRAWGPTWPSSIGMKMETDILAALRGEWSASSTIHFVIYFFSHEYENEIKTFAFHHQPNARGCLQSNKMGTCHLIHHSKAIALPERKKETWARQFLHVFPYFSPNKALQLGSQSKGCADTC